MAMVALLILGSAILLFSCKEQKKNEEGSLDAIMTEQSENLTIVMSENGRKSYLFKTPLLEGYTLGRDPYREFRKGISITTYQDDSMTTVNAVLVANYAIFYENRKLWEAKGDVVVTKHDGTRLYTQQLFWNSMTKRIYSNVDTKLVTETDELIGEGFESDEDMNEPRFRRWKGKMQINEEELKAQQADDDEGGNKGGEIADKRSEDAPKSATPTSKNTSEKAVQPTETKSSQMKSTRRRDDSAEPTSTNRPTPSRRVTTPVKPAEKPIRSGRVVEKQSVQRVGTVERFEAQPLE